MLKITLLLISLSIFQTTQAIDYKERLALIIGNAEYQGDAKLENPVNDAQDLAEVLRDLQFQVVLKQNLTWAEMDAAIKQFGKDLRVAKGMGLFYYAGHGMQVDGINYLIPIGGEQALFKKGYDLNQHTIKASDILKTVEVAANAVNIIILDACRDNPLIGRGIPRRPGLQLMNAPGGSLIAFAAKPGEVAFEGKGERNSPYAASLVQQIKNNPNSSLLQLFTDVRADVLKRTDKFQAPGFYSELNKDYCLMGECPKSKSGVDLDELVQRVVHLWQPIFAVVIAMGVLWLGWRQRWIGTVVTWGRYRFAPTVFDIGTKNWQTIVVASIVVSIVWFAWQQNWYGAVVTWQQNYIAEIKRQAEIARIERQAERQKEAKYGKRFEFETVIVNAKGKIIHREQKQARSIATDLGNGVTLDMVYIPGGTFMMGLPKPKKWRYESESPQHQVTIKPFFMSKYEVTQAQWQAVGFHGTSVDELESAFHEAVNHYLAICEKIGQKPQKPYSGDIMLSISPEVHAAIANAAEMSNKSLNKWVADVLTQAVPVSSRTIAV
jgi:predicted HicB family RNase H-like nuclease